MPVTRQELIDAGIIQPSRFDVPMTATPAQLDMFRWARGINKPPDSLIDRVQRGLRALGGDTEDDINEKRKRKARAEQGIQTLGRL